VLPSNSEPRKGVPQGRHAHVLLVRGQGIMEAFFPASPRSFAPPGPCVWAYQNSPGSMRGTGVSGIIRICHSWP
jgi:hypothetical protein